MCIPLYRQTNSLASCVAVWVSFTAPNGERIRRSAGTEDRKQAQEYHDRLKVELWRVHKLGEKPRRSWQEAVVRWLRACSHY